MGRGSRGSVHELYSPVGESETSGGFAKETALQSGNTEAAAVQHILGAWSFVAAIPVEYASERKIRERNKLYYRFNHWPIWIFVFFIAPGPLTLRSLRARLRLAHGALARRRARRHRHRRAARRLPGVEPKPYIIRFTEDRPNPLYRRVCYTFAWSEVITFAVLNATGLAIAIVTGGWHLKMSQIYRVAYFPLAGSIWLLGALGQLPRVKASTKGEGHERRYFYGSVWAVCWAQPAAWLLWKVLPQTRVGDAIKLAVFLAILAFVGNLARQGRLPRTRPIVPGELAVFRLILRPGRRVGRVRQ